MEDWQWGEDSNPNKAGLEGAIYGTVISLLLVAIAVLAWHTCVDNGATAPTNPQTQEEK